MDLRIAPVGFLRDAPLTQNVVPIFAGIGAFRHACVQGRVYQQPLEVVLVHGSRTRGFHACLGDAAHAPIEGALSAATVSFTLEAFTGIDVGPNIGQILSTLALDSATTSFRVERAELRESLLAYIQRTRICGAVVHVTGIASSISTYGHTDCFLLNDATKTFDHMHEPVAIDGWGNISVVDGVTPFVHMHGVYSTPHWRKAAHFIMDEKTPLPIISAVVTVHPLNAPLVRTKQGEDFPTWTIR